MSFMAHLQDSLEDIWATLLKKWGIYDSPKTYDMTGNQFVVVPKVFKRCCIPETQLFTTPIWLLNQDVLSKLTDNGVEAIKGMQDALTSLLAGDRMVRLFRNLYCKYYSVDELIDLRKGFF
jgi:hypothetical protein